MKKGTIALTVLAAGFLGIAAIAAWLALSFTPSNPLDGSNQLVLVLATTARSNKAVLQFFDRDGDTWRFSFSCSAVIGRNGVAWGRGLHSDRDRTDGDPVKVEGDGASPQGAFPLVHAYGYPPPTQVRISFPYTQSGPDLICCDDPGSRYYNEIVNVTGKKLDPARLPSHEKMLRSDDLYKYAVLVGHNTRRPKPGAGSCIFIHLWRNFNSPTAGCTAISEGDMLTLLSELDIDKNPVMVLLTRRNYLRLRDEWGLPEVTI